MNGTDCRKSSPKSPYARRLQPHNPGICSCLRPHITLAYAYSRLAPITLRTHCWHRMSPVRTPVFADIPRLSNPPFKPTSTARASKSASSTVQSPTSGYHASAQDPVGAADRIRTPLPTRGAQLLVALLSTVPITANSTPASPALCYCSHRTVPSFLPDCPVNTAVS